MGATSQDQFLSSAQHIAFYGLKRSGKGFAQDILKGLQSYRDELAITAVHPEADSLHDLPVVQCASQIKPAADSAVVMLKPADAIAAIDDAAHGGVKRIWLAMDSSNTANLQRARDCGMEVVDGCPLLFLPDQGFPHNFHRWLARLFGKL